MCLQYYGPYGYIQPNSNSVPKPNVNVDIVPGCNILRNQFAVANYSGPLPCTLPGAPAGPAAGGRRLMQAAFQNTNTSAECVVWHSALQSCCHLRLYSPLQACMPCFVEPAPSTSAGMLSWSLKSCNDRELSRVQGWPFYETLTSGSLSAQIV